MNNPIISILIPNYNKAPYLKETLDSIMFQSYLNWECIIVDDHSSDDSWEILNEYSQKDDRFKILKRPNNLPKGGNSCRNYALNFSRGKLIQWFDSDDILLRDSLENRTKLILSDINLDFVIFSGNMFKSSIRNIIKGNRLNWINNPSIFSLLELRPEFLTQSILFKREFLIRNNLIWNTNIYVLQDILFNIKVLESDSFFISSKSQDWFWRIHDDGKNVGSKRGSFKNLHSLSLFIFEVYRLIHKDKVKLRKFRLGVFKIIFSTINNWSITWFRLIIYKVYVVNFINLLQIFILFSIFIFSYPFRKTFLFEYQKSFFLKFSKSFLS